MRCERAPPPRSRRRERRLPKHSRRHIRRTSTSKARRALTSSAHGGTRTPAWSGASPRHPALKRSSGSTSAPDTQPPRFIRSPSRSRRFRRRGLCQDDRSRPPETLRRDRCHRRSRRPRHPSARSPRCLDGGRGCGRRLRRSRPPDDRAHPSATGKAAGPLPFPGGAYCLRNRSGGPNAVTNDARDS